jgi:hypothetical protein
LLLEKIRWWPGVFIGLLVLTRPDAAILGMLVLGAWMSSARLRNEALFVNIAAAAAVYLPWAVYAARTFHDVVPFPVRAKLAVQGPSGEINVRTLIAFFAPGPVHPYVFWIEAMVAVIGGVVVWQRAPRLRPFVIWVPAYYCIMVAGNAPDFMWYYVPPFWMAGLLLFMGIKAMCRRSTAIAVALVVSVLLVSAADNGLAIHKDLLMNPNIRFHRHLADRIASVAEPGDVLAAQEVGFLAYWTPCSILDMLAVTCPEVLDHARKRDRSAIISDWKPDFVALHHADDEPALQHGYRLLYRRYYCDSSYVLLERTDP